MFKFIVSLTLFFGVLNSANAQVASSYVLEKRVLPHEPGRNILATRFDDHRSLLFETVYYDLPSEWHMQQLDVYDGQGELVISVPYEFHPGRYPIYTTGFDIGLNRERTSPGQWTAVVLLDGVEMAETSVWVVDDYADLQWDDPNQPVWLGREPRQLRPDLGPHNRGSVIIEMTIDDAGFVETGVVRATTPSILEVHEERMRGYAQSASGEEWFDPLLESKRPQIRGGHVVYEVAEPGTPFGVLDDMMITAVSQNRYLPISAGRHDSVITTERSVVVGDNP